MSHLDLTQGEYFRNNGRYWRFTEPEVKAHG